MTTTAMTFDAETIVATMDAIMNETGMAQLPAADRRTAAVGVETMLHERVAAAFMRALTADQQSAFRIAGDADALGAFVTSACPDAERMAVRAVVEARDEFLSRFHEGIVAQERKDAYER